jgi:hypothetical protein
MPEEKEAILLKVWQKVEEVEKSRYGRVNIVIAEGRVVQIEAETKEKIQVN